MATYTDNYQLTLPTYAEVADIATINNNMTKIDEIMHDSQISIATAYDASTTSENPYNTGDIVMYEKIAYKCKYDGVYGTWDASKWEQTTLADNLGGGDASEISYDNTTSGLTADDVQEAIDELEGNIEDVSDGLDDAVESLAPAFDSTETYNEGDIVSKDNKLYQCNTDNTTGDWDSTKWDEYVVSEHMGEGGSTVIITPETIAEPKQKIADFEIDGASGSLYAPIVEIDGHASGAIANFPDGANNKPLKSLIVAIDPVQASGTPIPENPIPISGWTGAKIANISDINKQPFFDGLIKGTYKFVDMGGLEWYSVSQNRFYANLTDSKYNSGNTTNVLCPNYKTEASVVQGNMWLNQSKVYVVDNRYSSASDFKSAMQGIPLIYELETPITPTITQEQYNSLINDFDISGYLYPITWSEAGTVYGGYIEFKDGEWKGYKTHEIYTINELKSGDGVFGQTNNGYAVYKTMPVGRQPSSSICDKFEYNNNSYSNMPLYSYGGNSGVPTTWTFILPSTITSKTEASAWFAENPTTLTYKLETPIEISLDTPLPNIKTLLGNNNLWSDTGDILECVYQRDLNLVINQFDERITALEQALSGTRSLSLSKSAPTEEVKEEEETKEEER